MGRVLHLHRDRLGPLTPPDDDDPDLVNTEATCHQMTAEECSV